jgi:hypothetical protein
MNEIKPRRGLKWARLERKRQDARMMGTSVTKGAIATFTPSLALCFRV